MKRTNQLVKFWNDVWTDPRNTPAKSTASILT